MPIWKPLMRGIMVGKRSSPLFFMYFRVYSLISLNENEIHFSLFHNILLSSDSAAITLVSVSENIRVVSTQRWFDLNLYLMQVHRIYSTKEAFVFLLWSEHVPTLGNISMTWYILLYSSQEYISNVLLIHNRNLAIQEWNLCKTGDFSARNYSQHKETHSTSFELIHISEP